MGSKRPPSDDEVFLEPGAKLGLTDLPLSRCLSVRSLSLVRSRAARSRALATAAAALNLASFASLGGTEGELVILALAEEGE